MVPIENRRLHILVVILGVAMVLWWAPFSKTPEEATKTTPAATAPRQVTPLHPSIDVMGGLQIQSPRDWIMRSNQSGGVVFLAPEGQGFRDNLNISPADPFDVDQVMPELCALISEQLARDLDAFESRSCAIDAERALPTVRHVFSYRRRGEPIEGVQFMISGASRAVFALCSTRRGGGEAAREACEASAKTIAFQVDQ